MSLKNKLNLWVENKLISKEEQDNIMAFEREHNNGFLAKTALVVAGLFIGLGICLIVAANWDLLPAFVKIVGDFAVFGGMAGGAYYAVQKQKPHLKDMFLFLNFLMTGATIGLIAQVFQMSGSWQSFALFWSVLSVPYVLLSGSFSLGSFWVFVFISGLAGDVFEKILEYFLEDAKGLMLFVLICCALSYAFEMIYCEIKKKVLLVKVFEKWMMFFAYFALIALAFDYGFPSKYNHDFSYAAVAFVVLFFAARLGWAFRKQNMLSFKRNTLMFEGYVFLFFASLFDDLLTSGFGFILGGLFILLMFYVFKKTASKLKKWEIFK